MSPVLELTELTCHYPTAANAVQGREPALQPITLNLARGEFCVLLGESGAGKSTLLRCIAGLQAHSAGELKVCGSRLAAGKPRARRGRVSFIHQGIDLVPRLSVLGNVLAGALGELSLFDAVLGRYGDARRRRACALLHEVGLGPEHLYRRAQSLSGGQQQRVGIARAFMAQPPLVLADEPVASLDPRSSREVMELLRRAAREHGAAVLCSLHQLPLALEFADRVIGLKQGRCVFDCTPRALDAQRVQTLYGHAARTAYGEAA